MQEPEAGSRKGSSRATDHRWPRRKVLKAITAAGVGSAIFGRALVTLAADAPAVGQKAIRQAEWISGLDLTGAEREMMVEGINDALVDYAALRKVTIDNGVAPAIRFDPSPWQRPANSAGHERNRPFLPPALTRADRPTSDDDLAYASVTRLAGLLRGRQISSVELTRLYLERLRRFDPVLQCVITYTEELALKQAEAADREIAAGRYRGPLHGIPWGAKDLIAVPGYRTTWGAMPYKNQMRKETATVAARLDRAGAVLVAKLSVGALAWGDVWFGGKTKNPWNTEQGSSGSSAGPAAVAAGGLAGFTIGTETLGSIVSPCTRCGASGLRPTFGRVSRFGVMALSWSMDKIGPISRSVEDCAMIFDAIHGADGLDPSAVDRPFEWPSERDLGSLRVGYIDEAFEEDRTRFADDEEGKARLREWQAFDKRTLQELRDMGIRLIPMKLPSKYPVGSLGLILDSEAGTAFDELTRSGRDDELVRQSPNAWPNVFRQAQMRGAVEYLRANRIRTLVMQEMKEVMAGVDVYISPSFGSSNLLLTNLTGHPTVVLPNGFRSSGGTPTSITFMGKLYGESDLLTLATAYQRATTYHTRRPPLG